ncbi:hypothetical protein [Kushneria phosphatilytica]|uniref:Uncharacterized protein n=1 Tax=Kushneria phosphatilytica TaxID=657387 RepID=A0A1S1NT17_9GAMM|nr:hypothetical protein [Kushneria phosphatilytica]OHV09920.1 hypothetical protein BH688_09840 [Kushneria phosphatilytica]QEL11586.1 hypothetical protein FY550_10910 [Kushneria phosphatilytica]
MIIRWESGHDYVLVHVHRDMFGDWILSRAWGQIGTGYGGLRHALAESFDQAMTWVDSIDHIQTSRGFERVWSSEDDDTPEARHALAQLNQLSEQ